MGANEFVFDFSYCFIGFWLLEGTDPILTLLHRPLYLGEFSQMMTNHKVLFHSTDSSRTCTQVRLVLTSQPSKH